MEPEQLHDLKEILNTFFLECSTLSNNEDDYIEKYKILTNGYTVYLICKKED